LDVRDPGPVRRFRRGASILPSLFTTGNLFLGFWSIIRTLEGRFEVAAALIGGSIVLDMLDGRIARLTGTSSEFVLRLARFNVQLNVADLRYFVGLPIPAAAGQVATLVYFLPDPVTDRVASLAVMWGLVVVAILMVSTLRYRSFKGIDLRARRSYVVVLVIAGLLTMVAAHAEVTLLVLASLYTLSGPTWYLASLIRRRSDPPPAVATGTAH
jgi:CDP-diacylglycerol--serine O-phosphatidyltransferase